MTTRQASADRLIASIAPKCHEVIIAALSWNRSVRSMSEFMADASPWPHEGDDPRYDRGPLPDPVLIAVASDSILAFEFSPRLLGVKVKKQVACWSRREVTIRAERTNTVTWLTITTLQGETHALETDTMTMRKAGLVDAFLAAAGVENVKRLYLGY